MILHEWITDLHSAITAKHIYGFLTAILILLVGFFVARRASQAMAKLPHLDTQQKLVFSKAVYYGLVTIAIAAALGQMGFDLKVLLGAAGILTVAIGFAAQTSASNLISGLFLMLDRPFVVGNFVAVGDIRGEVVSIDLLSCKLRTFNNVMVRIPNETMVKSNITNFSYFPIRRLDINVGVGYNSNITQVEAILRDIATAHPLCLDDPPPVFLFTGFGDSSMNIQFQVWTLNQNLIKLQNELYRDIKIAFDRYGIDIPFPIRQLISAPSAQVPSPAAGPLA